MGKIASLLAEHKESRVYIYLDNTEICNRFLQDAENEGFTFGDGVKPTRRDGDNIFAINNDRTLNYVGFVGHLAFQFAKKVNGKPLVRIDYRDLIKD